MHWIKCFILAIVPFAGAGDSSEQKKSPPLSQGSGRLVEGDSNNPCVICNNNVNIDVNRCSGDTSYSDAEPSSLAGKVESLQSNLKSLMERLEALENDVRVSDSIGFSVKEKSKVDNAEFWTFIDKSGFKYNNAEIRKIEFFSAMADRSVSIGIFRKVGSKECRYRLIVSITVGKDRMRRGENTIWLTPDERRSLIGHKGDSIGIFWNNQGVIPYDFDTPENMNYCEKDIFPFRTQVKDYNTNNVTRSARKYAIKVSYSKTSNSEP